MSSNASYRYPLLAFATLAVLIGTAFALYGGLLIATRAQDEDHVSGAVGVVMVTAGAVLLLVAGAACYAARRLRP